ncbi:hypothetical protein [Litoreibacter arenae]|uniref:Uncharacterized protein n=1 Tax=Litoreibacter arenae DSM 19593 TaxID=1123360 RepID=S9QM71_9RHOB|nr:hypothetical protein [Litoreibacter arenae]EPX80658.1 hypothetical protein thalar_00878 [Litoreibacter arenae DSM 19593]
MPTAATTSLTPNESLSVTVVKEGFDSFRVSSLELVSDDIANSYSFRKGRPLDVVFVPEFARTLLTLLLRTPVEDEAVLMPDFAFSHTGIGLSGLSLHAEPDGRVIVMRFKRYVGDMRRVLQFEQSTELSPADMRERIAVDVLEDIISPIFDMLALADMGGRDVLNLHADAIAARLDKVAAQQEELKFFIGLLKRYVAGCQEDAALAGWKPSKDVVPLKRHGSV